MNPHVFGDPFGTSHRSMPIGSMRDPFGSSSRPVVVGGAKTRASAQFDDVPLGGSVRDKIQRFEGW